jgi:condensin complex subunit 3
MHEDLEDDQEMISPYQFGLLVVDWTNPQKTAPTYVYSLPPLAPDVLTEEWCSVKTVAPDQDVHAELAIDIVAALYHPDRSGKSFFFLTCPRIDLHSAEDLKALCQLLGNLQIMPGLDHRSILKLNILLSHHEDVSNTNNIYNKILNSEFTQQCPFNDASLDKIFNKFHSNFTQIFAKDLHHINPGQPEYQDEEFHTLYDFIGVDIPDPSSRVQSPSHTSRTPSPAPRSAHSITQKSNLI